MHFLQFWCSAFPPSTLASGTRYIVVKKYDMKGQLRLPLRVPVLEEVERTEEGQWTLTLSSVLALESKLPPQPTKARL